MAIEGVTKEHVETTLVNLQERLKEAQKYQRDADAELSNAKSKVDRIQREIKVWETTIAAFKEAGIV